MPEHITTYGGTYFYPTEPQAEGVHIRDIAHSLSLVCRGNGHVTHFFSVAQHCINCAREAEARGYSQRVVLACLLHDASESYLSDVPRPFKACLPDYRLYENRLLDVIYKRFLGSELTPGEQAQVREIDDDMLYFDMRDLLHDAPNRPEPVMKSVFSTDYRPFEEVEAQYLDLYEKYRMLNVE